MVYKRTHTGDPNEKGEFGCHNCMGKCRKYRYDAVIGIGGLHPDKGYENISCKITWIGIGPKLGPMLNDLPPVVTFDKFVLLDSEGPYVTESLHPKKLPREVILYDERPGYEKAYNDAKIIIDQLIFEKFQAQISKPNYENIPQNSCLKCKK